jgi:hypothetical protein
MTARAELRPLVGRRIVVISIDRSKPLLLVAPVTVHCGVLDHDDPQVFLRVQTQKPITHNH